MILSLRLWHLQSIRAYQRDGDPCPINGYKIPCRTLTFVAKPLQTQLALRTLSPIGRDISILQHDERLRIEGAGDRESLFTGIRLLGLLPL